MRLQNCSKEYSTSMDWNARASQTRYRHSAHISAQPDGALLHTRIERCEANRLHMWHYIWSQFIFLRFLPNTLNNENFSENTFLVVTRHTFYVICHCCATNLLCRKKNCLSATMYCRATSGLKATVILAPTTLGVDTSSQVMDIQLAIQDS